MPFGSISEGVAVVVSQSLLPNRVCVTYPLSGLLSVR